MNRKPPNRGQRSQRAWAGGSRLGQAPLVLPERLLLPHEVAELLSAAGGELDQGPVHQPLEEMHVNENAGVSKLLYTPTEAAQALGMSRTGFYRLIRLGEVESCKIGGLRRIPVAALERFVEALRHDEPTNHGPADPGQPAA